MDLTAAEIEELFEKLGMAGVTLLVHIEQPVLAAGGNPWTAQISGPAVRQGGIEVRDCGTFQECLQKSLTELRGGTGEWEWMDIYL